MGYPAGEENQLAERFLKLCGAGKSNGEGNQSLLCASWRRCRSKAEDTIPENGVSETSTSRPARQGQVSENTDFSGVREIWSRPASAQMATCRETLSLG